MNYFIYNGVSSADMGVRIQSKKSYSAPKYDVTLLTIPGRDGELIVQNGRFPNVTISYTCYLPAKSISDLADKITALKAWLYTEPNQYHILEDSYDTKFFRKAVYHNKLDITDQCLKIGLFTVNFTCMPFRYANDGQTQTSYMGSFTISNPYPFVAKPYIRVNGMGSGALVVQSATSNKVWNFETINGYTESDSEQMNFYHGTELKNDTVTGDGFPMLHPGENVISIEGGITSVDIIPRWVTL